MEKIEIRRLTQDDYFSIIELAPDDEYMAQMFISIANAVKSNFDGISYIYGAFVDSLIIGFIYGFVLPNKTLLPQYLYVDAEYRGNKIGNRLLKTLETDSECSCSLAYFEKGLSNYYEKQGYTIGNNVVAMKEL